MGTASIESLDDVPRAPAEPHAQQRFEAETRFGTLGLAWAGPHADPSAGGPASRLLQAALQLARAELLLQLLEDWLGEALDPAPAEGGHAPAASTACADCLLQDDQGRLQIRLELPWACLLQCPPEASDLRTRLDQVLQWRPVPVHLVISHQTLAAAEWAQLQRPGAALLLPESFTAGVWSCRVRSPQGQVPERGLFWRPDDGGLAWQAGFDRCQPPAAPLSRDQLEVEVRLHQPVQLTPPQLAGWPGAPQPACRGDRAVVLCRDASGRAHAPLHGHLLPLGLLAARVHHPHDDAGTTSLSAGYALRIEEVLS